MRRGSAIFPPIGIDNEAPSPPHQELAAVVLVREARRAVGVEVLAAPLRVAVPAIVGVKTQKRKNNAKRKNSSTILVRHIFLNTYPIGKLKFTVGKLKFSAFKRRRSRRNRMRIKKVTAKRNDCSQNCVFAFCVFTPTLHHLPLHGSPPPPLPKVMSAPSDAPAKEPSQDVAIFPGGRQ